ncbi:MAG TPA: ABC transporter ATP-binding protein [Conexibacter sp.]|jgi:putative spermidine/putrescine transport system ATP-binding protein
MSITQTGHGIRLAGLSKRFGRDDEPAVDDVSLDIAPGEFMTFLGPSGSGKSTTLNLIAGFTEATSGRVEIDGADVTPLPPHRRRLGVVFQFYALFPHMTAARNVAFGLRYHNVPKREVGDRVARALRLVRMERYADRLPSQLSGGQQQRVALARAIVCEPRAILLDEPLGALDKRLREELQVEIARMHRDLGTTFVFVTHDQDEALRLSSRIAVFNAGKVEQLGTPDQLYDHPRTLFIAEFLGESNCFHGRLDAAGRLDTGWAKLRASVEPIGPRDVALIVRPEALRLGDLVRDGDNVVEADVVSTSFAGRDLRVELRYADGRPGLALLAHGETAPQPGARVRIGWDPQRQAQVPAEPQPPAAAADAAPAAAAVV